MTITCTSPAPNEFGETFTPLRVIAAVTTTGADGRSLFAYVLPDPPQPAVDAATSANGRTAVISLTLLIAPSRRTLA
ncbi:MAG: hypothetical protein NVSMB51_09550 [Solirubrobacteraceae bacterium]